VGEQDVGLGALAQGVRHYEAWRQRKLLGIAEVVRDRRDAGICENSFAEDAAFVDQFAQLKSET